MTQKLPKILVEDIDEYEFDVANKLVKLDAAGLLKLAQVVGNILGLDAEGKLDLTQIGTKAGDLGELLKSPTKLIIATGAITKTQTCQTIDTESDAATDDLDTINGGSAGDILILSAADDARTVVCKHGTGNLRLNGQVDFSLDNTLDTITLIYNGTNWCEVSRANNGV